MRGGGGGDKHTYRQVYRVRDTNGDGGGGAQTDRDNDRETKKETVERWGRGVVGRGWGGGQGNSPSNVFRHPPLSGDK